MVLVLGTLCSLSDCLGARLKYSSAQRLGQTRDLPRKLGGGQGAGPPLRLSPLWLAECLAPTSLEEAVGGGPASGAALLAVTSQGAEGRPTDSAPSPRLPCGPSVLWRCCCRGCSCRARRRPPARSTAVAPECLGAHPSRAMRPGTALQAVLLAVLLVGLRAATGRLLSGECARWGGGWCRGGLTAPQLLLTLFWVATRGTRRPSHAPLPDAALRSLLRSGGSRTASETHASSRSCAVPCASWNARSPFPVQSYGGGLENVGEVGQWANLPQWVPLRPAPLHASSQSLGPPPRGRLASWPPPTALSGRRPQRQRGRDAGSAVPWEPCLLLLVSSGGLDGWVERLV